MHKLPALVLLLSLWRRLRGTFRTSPALVRTTFVRIGTGSSASINASSMAVAFAAIAQSRQLLM